TQLLNDKEMEISNLTSSNKLEISKAMQQKDSEIERLKNQLSSIDNEKDMAIDKAVLATQYDLNKQLAEINKQLTDKQLEIERLKNSYTQQLNEKDSKMRELKSNYETTLRLKEEEVERYKDFKAKQSTKLLGETLEKHCEYEFNKLRPLFQNVYFEKDNDAHTGSKGDYIFKALADDGSEIVSIMFEMKNEADMTTNKKKNEDFLKELDKDRNEKNCEYAVLVSMLEAENELYNSGIVDMSHRFPKMYVIRPQFFIPIITILRNAANKSLEYKKELAIIHNQNIDITNFENEMNKFKATFGLHYNAAKKNFEAAIKQIDNSIECLQKVKSALTDSENALRLANQNAEDLSIKRLTKNNPTMLAKFDELKKKDN
ncbi:MAG: DUF2130 domain-containing protein, partial [Clostridia bacterium]|nr:DUF2130 domain-containing protein [Clostridia bacterium]